MRLHTDTISLRFIRRSLAESCDLHVWAQISAATELAGQALSVMDSLLMATAQCHGLTVVTRNAQDFALLPQVFNPWAL